MNNLPAAVLLSAHTPAHPRSLLVGLNIGPNLAITGSLSVILWLQVARASGARPSLSTYSVLGILLVPTSIAAALTALAVFAPGRSESQGRSPLVRLAGSTVPLPEVLTPDIGTAVVSAQAADRATPDGVACDGVSSASCFRSRVTENAVVGDKELVGEVAETSGEIRMLLGRPALEELGEAVTAGGGESLKREPAALREHESISVHQVIAGRLGDDQLVGQELLGGRRELDVGSRSRSPIWLSVALGCSSRR